MVLVEPTHGRDPKCELYLDIQQLMIWRHLSAYMLKFQEFNMEVLFNEEFTNLKETDGEFETCWIWILRC